MFGPQIRKWLPASIVMAVIFFFSSLPSDDLPDLDWADRIIKKGGHILGYAILAWSYWRGLDLRANKRWLAWLLAMIFAVTDEFHQSYVPGRHSSVWDVIIFDNLGALISLWITSGRMKQKPSTSRTTRL